MRSIMDPNAGTLIDQWADPSLASIPGWVDCAGRSPVTLYREYLQRRREWEARAWRLAGATKSLLRDGSADGHHWAHRLRT